jgi:subtilisin family serine protease
MPATTGWRLFDRITFNPRFSDGSSDSSLGTICGMAKRSLATCALTLAFVSLMAPSWAAGDPKRSLQWGLTRVRADQAWSASKGAGVTIAIVDTGIDLTHPDLKGKIVSHYTCIDTCTTGGDDNNGHGSHVAGIAAASTSNGIGIAGVAPAAKLMAVKVLASDGSGNCGDIDLGVRWATDHGADVINLSLGPDLTLDLLCGLQNAAEYAWNKGIVVVVSAGNNGLINLYGSSSLIVVGATGPNDEPASYSNSGADIYAPGGNRGGAPCSPAICVYSTWKDGGYNAIQGTSMATPHVSGVAALLLARGYKNTQILPRLRSTADDIDGILRVNAARAAGSVAGTKTTKPRSSSGSSSSGSQRPGGATPRVVPGSSASPSLPNGVTPMPLSSASQRSTLGLQAAGAPLGSGRPSRTIFISVATGFAMLAGAGYVGRLLRSH